MKPGIACLLCGLNLLVTSLMAQNTPKAEAEQITPDTETQAKKTDQDPSRNQDKEKGKKPQKLAPVIVTALKIPSRPFDTPRSVNSFDREFLIQRNENSALDALNRSIGIWIEKRTATTSDPVIRGLSGANILALLDGNNVTTFWGEGGFAGDDLYGKIEAESLERIELIRGPASVQYGANALGGVLNFITRGPDLVRPESGVRFGGQAKLGYDTINDGKVARFDLETALPKLRLRLGGTWRDLGDGRAGGDGKKLAPSGGEDQNFDLNADYMLGRPDQVLFAQWQQVNRRKIARYYRPTQRNENDRTGIVLGYRDGYEHADDMFEGRVYYQWKEDRRYWDTGEWGYANWQTISTDWVLRRADLLLPGRTAMGISLRYEQGESPDDEQFTMVDPITGAKSKAAPDQDWYNAGVFLEQEWDVNDWLTLTGGIRYDYFIYQSHPDAEYTPPVGNPEDDRLDEQQGALTGGLGALFRLSREWHVGASWTRGFRMFPARFGISKTGFGVLVPSGFQDPVTADNYEITIKHRSETFETNLAGYYVDFNGFQENKPGSFQGQDFYDYNGNGTFEPDERVYVVTGDSQAYVYGIEWDAIVRPTFVPQGSFVSGGVMWNYGQDTTADEPLRHTHPLRGLLSIGYEEPFEQKWYFAFDAEFVGKFDRISSARLQGDVGYRQEPQDPTSPLIRDYGLPGYSTLNFRFGYKISDHIRFGMSIDNITNKLYRPAHSRMDAFGTTGRFFFKIDA